MRTFRILRTPEKLMKRWYGPQYRKFMSTYEQSCDVGRILWNKAEIRGEFLH
jgi:hypothetical protein